MLRWCDSGMRESPELVEIFRLLIYDFYVTSFLFTAVCALQFAPLSRKSAQENTTHVSSHILTWTFFAGSRQSRTQVFYSWVSGGIWWPFNIRRGVGKAVSRGEGHQQQQAFTCSYLEARHHLRVITLEKTLAPLMDKHAENGNRFFCFRCASWHRTTAMLLLSRMRKRLSTHS